VFCIHKIQCGFTSMSKAGGFLISSTSPLDPSDRQDRMLLSPYQECLGMVESGGDEQGGLPWSLVFLNSIHIQCLTIALHTLERLNKRGRSQRFIDQRVWRGTRSRGDMEESPGLLSYRGSRLHVDYP
jgi:hypothetical protein